MLRIIIHIKKSQAALEFLTTYIWAFGVLLVLIGALVYFGVLSPSKFLPQRCSFGAEIGCSDYTIASNGVQMRLKNNVGQPIIVDSITASNEKTSLSCTSSIVNTVWPAGSVKDVPVVCDFTGTGIVEGDKEKLDLKISYYKSGSSSTFSKEVQGEVFAPAKSGAVPGVENVVLGTSPQDILNNGFSYGDGTYTIDPDGIGPTVPFQVYADMTTDGGGWTLIFQRRGGANNVETCGSTILTNTNEFLHSPCGSPSALGYSDSYSIDVDVTPAHTEYLVVQFDHNLVADLDDAFIIGFSGNMFPDTTGLSNILVDRVCDIDNLNCDKTAVYWKYAGDDHFLNCVATMVTQSNYGGMYGYCHNGLSNYNMNILFGDRNRFSESKLWSYSGNQEMVERVFIR